jgi:DNA repair protein RadA/Sms
MPVKARTQYVCSDCGAKSTRWLGRCHECGAWNTFEERVAEPEPSRRESRNTDVVASSAAPVPLSEVASAYLSRLSTAFGELDRALGGGIVPGSVVLLGGEPGIGKSTLLLQVMGRVGETLGTALYVTGEESLRQIKLRAERLHTAASNVYLLCETQVEAIVAQAERLRPRVVVVDSIQTTTSESVASAPGTVSQIRDCASALIRFAKSSETPVVLVGHVTKEGTLAGPKVLEHMVDTVLTFEGEANHAYRLVRATKNRYGSTNELAFFEMTDEGLTEVLNPSGYLFAERQMGVSGSVVVCAMEGSRPLLLELQALVSPARYGAPMRVAAGFDRNRIALLLAVLEKRGDVALQNADVFVNVTGGIELEEPAADLGIVVALASNALNKPVDASTVVVGEVGLGGEVRSVSRLPQRVAEALQLGFKRVVVPKSQVERLRPAFERDGLRLVGVANLQQALGILL